mmetsp:Transcript_82179/g.232678  ORF Transcript_82179/g.232678 Transcript_82179/m.232678 type:complete len:276 (-) Transcript_82179:920-1747(-)
MLYVFVWHRREGVFLVHHDLHYVPQLRGGDRIISHVRDWQRPWAELHDGGHRGSIARLWNRPKWHPSDLCAAVFQHVQSAFARSVRDRRHRVHRDLPPLRRFAHQRACSGGPFLGHGGGALPNLDQPLRWRTAHNVACDLQRVLARRYPPGLRHWCGRVQLWLVHMEGVLFPRGHAHALVRCLDQFLLAGVAAGRQTGKRSPRYGLLRVERQVNGAGPGATTFGEGGGFCESQVGPACEDADEERNLYLYDSHRDDHGWKHLLHPVLRHRKPRRP